MKYYTNDPDAMVVFRNGHRLPFCVVLESLAHAFGSGKTNVMENDAEFERLHPRDAIGRFVKKSTEFIRIISKGMGGEDITGNFVQMPDEEDPDRYGISELSREEYATICKRMKIFRIDNAALNPYFCNRVLEKI